MKRALTVLIAGMLVAVGTFVYAHLRGTAASRELLRDPQPELAWLKREFNLTDAELARVSELHNAYLPKCAARCQLIAKESEKLAELLQNPVGAKDEIEKVIARRAELRGNCETEMLQHFLEVSRTMPPEQGRKYLAWVCEQTSLSGSAMERQHEDSQGHVHHHH